MDYVEGPIRIQANSYALPTKEKVLLLHAYILACISFPPLPFTLLHIHPIFNPSVLRCIFLPSWPIHSIFYITLCCLAALPPGIAHNAVGGTGALGEEHCHPFLMSHHSSCKVVGKNRDHLVATQMQQESKITDAFITTNSKQQLLRYFSGIFCCHLRLFAIFSEIVSFNLLFVCKCHCCKPNNLLWLVEVLLAFCLSVSH